MEGLVECLASAELLESVEQARFTPGRMSVEVAGGYRNMI